MNNFARIRLFTATATRSTLVLAMVTAAVVADDTEQRPFGLAERVSWTASRMAGSPDPPPPYVAVKTLTGIEWNRPIFVDREPDGQHLFVVEQGGEKEKPSQLFRILDRADATEKRLLLAVPRRLVYSMTFHPRYEANGFIYLFSNGPTGATERVNRVTRYTVVRDAGTATCDPDSAVDIIEWRSMGHDGGGLVFGDDGMLYITSGDGTSDSDKWLSAQDVSNLLGGVLRIDVDHPADGKPYAIPPDNPFRRIADARGEWWAIGLRNPWRMSIDKRTGQIWVGNNGQDLWESVHLLRKGANFGWSVYEGSHPFYAHRELGPGRLAEPTFEHHHTEARSLTGGVTYDGEQWADLAGAYLYGDHSTGKIWAGRHDGSNVTFHREIADTSLHIVAFSNTHHGELLVVDQTAGIHRLVPNPDLGRLEQLPRFPTRLSETGLFASTAEHRMAAGLIPYDVVSPGWTDGARAQRFIAVPDDLKVTHTKKRGWNFPDRSVLVQTLSIDDAQQAKRSTRRLETRVLLKQQDEWQGYTYLWNDEQTDAALVGSAGQDLRLADGRAWRVPSRAECMSCHARAVKYVLGLTDLQMNRDFDYSGTVDNQLRTLAHIGLLTGYKPDENRPKLVDPRDPAAALTARARSYLHTNCSCCHVHAGGGNARMELELTTQTEDMRIIDEYPQHATFGFSQPRIVAAGEPARSVLLARVSRRGRGQMPPLVSRRVDAAAVDMLQEWISSMPPQRQFVRNWSVADLAADLPKVQQGRSVARGKALFRSAGCGHCHRIEDELAGIGPNLARIADRRKPAEILESIVAPSAKIEPKYASTILLTVEGKVIKGRIQSESDEAIVMRGDESFATPRLIRKQEIEARKLSPVSMMPKGTINHLQREEVLDLLAYLLASSSSGD